MQTYLAEEFTVTLGHAHLVSGDSALALATGDSAGTVCSKSSGQILYQVDILIKMSLQAEPPWTLSRVLWASSA